MQVHEYKKVSQFMKPQVIKDALRGQSVSTMYGSVKPDYSEDYEPTGRYSRNLLERAYYESEELDLEDSPHSKPLIKDRKAMIESYQLLAKPISRRTADRIQSRAANLSEVLLSTQADSKPKITLSSS